MITVMQGFDASASPPDASIIPFAPAEGIAATNVQAAVVEALTDARAYTLGLVNGLDIKLSVRVASMVALPANTRVGNVLTADADGALPLLDTVTCVALDRVLVNAESVQANNGIYVIDSVGSPTSRWQMTRASDADTDLKVTSGLVTSAIEGADPIREWILISPDPITLNVSPLVFEQFTPYPRDILVGDNGGTGGDVVTRVGSSMADGAVSATAKLMSIRTGIGGTEVEKLFITKAGIIVSATGIKMRSNQADGASAVAAYVDTNAAWSTQGAVLLSVRTGTSVRLDVSPEGALRQWGTNTTGTPGDCTVARPCGIATILAGQTSCVITNSLVPDPALEKVRFHFTFHGDHGAARSWGVQTTGAFTVFLSSPASANTDFSWVGAKLIPGV